ncbi:MAG: chemotaxis protein CheW [Sideroxydans sp.]|nr:chemotaxis protein CheW [Sideroxydans sp.]
MNTTALARPAASATSALLKISGLRLQLPQKEISALETADSVVKQDVQPHSIGWLQHARQRWPVYCLSQNLTLFDTVPAERRACVLLGAGNSFVGILCDDVSISQPSQNQPHELPPAMRLAQTPVLGLVATGDEGIACITSAEQLIAHVTRLAGM